jgi:hypothetical protein
MLTAVLFGKIKRELVCVSYNQQSKHVPRRKRNGRRKWKYCYEKECALWSGSSCQFPYRPIQTEYSSASGRYMGSNLGKRTSWDSITPPQCLVRKCHNDCSYERVSELPSQSITVLTEFSAISLVSSIQEFLATDPEFRVRYPALPDFLRSSGSGTRFTQPSEYNWGATWRKSSGSRSRKTEITAVGDPPRWLRDTSP